MPRPKRKKRIRDLVVVVPGIMGSVLERPGDKEKLWEPKGGSLLRLLRGKESLALPPGQPDASDGVEATGLIESPAMVPDFWGLDSYTKLLDWLEETVDFQPGQLRRFPYDWRRDNRKSAEKLATESDSWLRDFKAAGGSAEAKLVIIAHSMGGLVARYFAEKLGGWRKIRLLATFGTPFGGAPKALGLVVNGLGKWGVRFAGLSEALRGFPSVHQLLPTYACFATGQGKPRTLAEEAPPGVDPGLLADALEFHTEIREAAESNAQDNEYLRAQLRGGYRLRPIVGVCQPTPQEARLQGGRIVLSNTLDDQEQDGDGTVPWVSALPVEDLGDIADGTPIPKQHLALHASGIAFGKLEFWLRGYEAPKRTLATRIIGLGLEVADVFEEREPVLIRVTPERPPTDLFVRVDRLDSGEEVVPATKIEEKNGWACELQPLPVGNYRLVVASRGDENVVPIEDLFIVVET